MPSGTYMPDRDDASQSRKPIPNDILQLIQKRQRKLMMKLGGWLR